MGKNKKYFIAIAGVVGFLAMTAFVVVGASVAYFLYNRNQATEVTLNHYEEPMIWEDGQDIDTYGDEDGNGGPFISELCEKERCPYEVSKWGVSFSYPEGWRVEDHSVYEYGNFVNVTDGFYRWILYADPQFTGGGTGYWVDVVGQEQEKAEGKYYSEVAAVKPANLNAFMVTEYVHGSLIPGDYVANVDSGIYWNWSILSTDLSNMPAVTGFGSGEMYDDIDYNFFSIKYAFANEYSEGGEIEPIEPPKKGDAQLNQALRLMDEITNSVRVQ